MQIPLWYFQSYLTNLLQLLVFGNTMSITDVDTHSGPICDHKPRGAILLDDLDIE